MFSTINHSTMTDAMPNQEGQQKVYPALLQPFKLTESLLVQNRIVMAPMTRCFAINNEPTKSMARYYGQRGSFGLIISEAVMVDQDASGYPDTPGIFSASQTLGWRRIADKVHLKGAKFFLQLWHAGMMSHPIYRRGRQPISASALVPKKDNIPRTKGALKYETSKPMDSLDMQEIRESFLNAALNSMEAGCDGVELHAANGYLLDSFLHYYSNKRTDEYGGSPENMSRFLLEILDDLVKAIGAERIGVRLSPVPVPSMQNMEEDVRDQQVFIYLLGQLKQRGIAYTHASSDNDTLDTGKLGMPVSQFLKTHFGKNVIGCGSYSLETGGEAIESGQFDLVAFGHLSIGNPDLVEIIKSNGKMAIKPFHPSMLSALN